MFVAIVFVPSWNRVWLGVLPRVAVNIIDPIGGTALAAALSKCSALQELNLDRNMKLGTDGAVAIICALKNMRSLEVVRLRCTCAVRLPALLV